MGRRRFDYDFQRGDPLSVDPFTVQAEIGVRELKLLAGAGEEDGIGGGGGGARRGGMNGGDDTFPPAILVEGVDVLGELEGAVELTRGSRADPDEIELLAELLGGVVVLEEGVELDKDLGVGGRGGGLGGKRGAGDDARVPRASETRFVEVDLHLSAFLEEFLVGGSRGCHAACLVCVYFSKFVQFFSKQ